MKVVLGTRGSKLALAQSEWVATQVRARGAEVEIRVLRTAGDVQTGPLSQAGYGVFVRELEQALLSGDISLAVHSLKDLPTGPRPGLVIAAVPPREDPRDALIARVGLKDLPAGSRVGTGSARRVAQLRAARPDLEYLPIRGNVDTRLRKFEAGEYDALILACAGLSRLGLAERITERLSPDVCLPAPGQGALALQVRANDAEMRALLAPLDDTPTRLAVTAERAFLEHLAGGCMVPVGALGQAESGRLMLRGVVADPGGQVRFVGEEAGPRNAPEVVGRALAARLLKRGADRVLEASRC